jgi:hypothetical protein
LASWTPDGFIGQMFRLVSSYVAPPPGVQAPVLWGTEAHLHELFGSSVTSIASTERTYVFRFESAERRPLSTVQSPALDRVGSGIRVGTIRTVDAQRSG